MAVGQSTPPGAFVSGGRCRRRGVPWGLQGVPWGRVGRLHEDVPKARPVRRNSDRLPSQFASYCQPISCGHAFAGRCASCCRGRRCNTAWRKKSSQYFRREWSLQVFPEKHPTNSVAHAIASRPTKLLDGVGRLIRFGATWGEMGHSGDQWCSPAVSPERWTKNSASPFRKAAGMRSNYPKGRPWWLPPGWMARWPSTPRRASRGWSIGSPATRPPGCRAAIRPGTPP